MFLAILKIWINGEHMKCEWTIFPGFTSLGILDEVQKMMTESKSELGHFKGRIIVMSMYNDIDWGKRIANAHRVTEYARRFARGHWSFPGPGSEKKWYGTNTYKSNGEWDDVAENMLLNFA